MNVQRFTGRTNKLALEQVRAAMGVRGAHPLEQAHS